MDGNIECVTLSDDDVADEELPSRNKKKKKDSTVENSTPPVETVDLEQLKETEQKENVDFSSPIEDFKKIQEEHEQFAEFLQKCIDYEYSEGMIQIINVTVLRAYRRLDNNYRTSSHFNKVISKALKRLCAEPNRKFSCINDLVDTLKLHEKKKRVQLTTLATNITKKQEEVSNIVLDSDGEQEPKNAPVINLDDENNEVIDLEQDDNEAGRIMPESQEHLEPQMELPIEWDRNTNNSNTEPISIDSAEETNAIDIDDEKNRQIKAIEQQIEHYKQVVAQLEESEVCVDSLSSPYVLCEKFKAKIVELYREFCRLVGQQPVKRRKVRLQVMEGHPAGPVRKLERFINDNMGEDGQPLFPDFCDVIKCVMAANFENNLGWSKQEVMREANALFLQCGRALQKRRQLREYKDLISTVNLTRADYDPADEDPQLQARLQRNRMVALKKETDIFEKYAQLQDLPQRPASGPSLTNQIDLSQTVVKVVVYPNDTGIYQNGSLMSQNGLIVLHGQNLPQNNGYLLQDNLDRIENLQSSEIEENNVGALENEEYENNDEENQTYGDEIGTGFIIQNVHSLRKSTETTKSLDDSDNSNFEPPEVCMEVIDDDENSVTDEPTAEDNKELILKKELKIKKEPIDVVQMLEELGDNYTTSITDIEDPFLVIEISSDSSDDDIEAINEPEDSRDC